MERSRKNSLSDPQMVYLCNKTALRAIKREPKAASHEYIQCFAGNDGEKGERVTMAQTRANEGRESIGCAPRRGRTDGVSIARRLMIHWQSVHALSSLFKVNLASKITYAQFSVRQKALSSGARRQYWQRALSETRIDCATTIT